MAEINIQGLFGDVLPDTAITDKAEGLRQAELINQQGAVGAYLAPKRSRMLKGAVGGLLGVDMRDDVEKARDALKSMGRPETAEQHKAYADILDKVKPGSGVQYMMGVAQEERAKQKADAATTSADAQMLNAVASANALPVELDLRKKEIDVREGELTLAGETEDNLVTWRETQDKNLQREYTIKEEANAIDRLVAENNKNALGAADKRAVREATASAREQTGIAQEATRIANEYLALEPLSGGLGQIVDQWQRFSGNTTEVTALRTSFNKLRNNMVMESLPPGVASDKDIEVAMSGFPTNSWGGEQIASYMRGMAKIAAITAEREGLRAKHMVENGGIDAGFDDEWRARQEDADFEQYMTDKYKVSWDPKLDEEGNRVMPVSQVEVDRRRQAAAEAEAEQLRRKQESEVAEVANFVNSINTRGQR